MKAAIPGADWPTAAARRLSRRATNPSSEEAQALLGVLARQRRDLAAAQSEDERTVQDQDAVIDLDA
jgi:hypothetical protein